MNEQEATSEIEKAWKKFTSSGKISLASLRPEIRESWERCRKLGIDPYDGSSKVTLSENELAHLLSKKKDLIAIAIPFMKRLFDLICYTGFAVVLTDEQGYILEIMATPDLEEALAMVNVNYKPGVRWREEDVGTNGIDLVLRQKCLCQITGAEHFAQTHHPVSCIGAPIFNADGQLAGTLTASGYAQAVQKHTTAMIVAAVEVISDEIMIREQNKQLTLTNNRLTNILMSMSDGVIVTDRNGVIQQTNPVAKQIIGHPRSDSGYGDISNYFDDEFAYTREVLGKDKEYVAKEVTIRSKPQGITVLATANSIKDEQDQIAGGIIVLTPKEKLQKLINRYVSTSARFHFSDIIGKSPAMRSALDLAERASRSSNNILLEGESGTGKEIFAHAIHNNSSRRNGPFVAINCGALPRELIASELFGYTEGAFTGAKKEGRPGKFELANGGTIFLDEIAEMPLDQQVNLLRVLQERRVTRIGSINEVPIDVMIICATNKNLQAEVIKNNFRQDLYYRLNVISIKIPPLRDRLEDIPLLVDFFISSMGTQEGLAPARVTQEVIDCLKRYSWPGNVRELQNVVEKMLLYCDGGYVGLERLPQEFSSFPTVKTGEKKTDKYQKDFLDYTRRSKKERVHEEERERLLLLLSRFGGNISQVSKELGVNRCTIYRKMRQYNITID